ncbi:MAG: hypothetical protein Kow00117_20910 [Phototrophicales bacterium]|nr:MAG: hypothetical protein CUN56_11930 [Phototrophicales bacterium]RMG72667.1 MAG: hypothetical protein D6711_12465 [Chloroflexota bacterium]
MAYIVRTIYLANFHDAVARVAKERRNPTDMNSLRDALKKLELADKTLENELNAYAGKGLHVVGTIRHDIPEYPADLLLTLIFEQEETTQT